MIWISRLREMIVIRMVFEIKKDCDKDQESCDDQSPYTDEGSQLEETFGIGTTVLNFRDTFDFLSFFSYRFYITWWIGIYDVGIMKRVCISFKYLPLITIVSVSFWYCSSLLEKVTFFTAGRALRGVIDLVVVIVRDCLAFFYNGFTVVFNVFTNINHDAERCFQYQLLISQYWR